MKTAILALLVSVLPFPLTATTNVDLAPSVERMQALLPGLPPEDSFNIDFLDTTRFTAEGFSGNWNYELLLSSVGRLTLTFDIDGNDPALYREEIILTFSTETIGTFEYRVYIEDVLQQPTTEGPFNLSWLSTGPTCWIPEGWVYVSWPYAYASGDQSWHFFSASEPSKLRVDLSSSQFGALSDASGWNYYAWPYAYSVDDETWYWYATVSIQWVFDFSSEIWELFGE